jgi:hypothetical protein
LLLEVRAGGGGGGVDRLARCDVPDVALDEALVVGHVDVADEADVDPAAVSRFERQILVGDVVHRLELVEGFLGCDDVAERAEVPDLLAEEIAALVAEQLGEIRVDVDHLAAVGLQDQDAILGGLEDAPVAQLGCA